MLLMEEREKEKQAVAREKEEHNLAQEEMERKKLVLKKSKLWLEKQKTEA